MADPAELPPRLEDWTGRSVVCFGAHPDDDLHAAGTFAALTRAGNRVHLVMYTDDDKGSLDRAMTRERLTAIRRAEQERAAGIVGVAPEDLHWLGHGDGELEYVDRRSLCRQSTALLRRLRPDAVFSFDPGRHWEQWHKSDHRSAAQNTADAVRAARWHLYFPELLDEGLEPHHVPVCFFFDSHEPDYFVDISATIDAKVEACLAHVSQFGRRVYAYEPELHPDDRATLAPEIRTHCAKLGEPHGMAFAEAFRRQADA